MVCAILHPLMKKREKTAILLFSRSAKRESYAKRWTNNANINLEIAEHLISNTHDLLQTAPFPVFHVDEQSQIGDTFGERLSNAFSNVFQKGFDYVIAVGNDCPHLQVDWHEISKQLIHQKTILGPDKRGGVYLIGLSKESNFDSKLMQVSWKGKFVFHQLLTLFDNCSIIDSRGDINTFRDVIRWEYLYKKIKSLLHKKIPIPEMFSEIHNPYFSLACLRAPPHSLLF